jgi:UDP-N-acetylmuramate dehydrogenase
VLVLGGGSNVVVADEGVDGLVLQLDTHGVDSRTVPGGVEVTAAAGEDWDELVSTAVERDWAGIECLSGIPGRVGATPIQNVGAYGQEISDSLLRVRCLDRATLTAQTFSREQCQLSYRDSRFKRQDQDRYVVLDVTFRLVPGGAARVSYGDLAKRTGSNPTLAAVRSAVLAARAEKSMLLDSKDPNGRSCGSFFVNPIVSRAEFDAIRSATPAGEPPHYPQSDGRVKLPAAWLIEHSGVHKGQRFGNVGVSSKHALAIVAHTGARSSEVRDLALHIKQRVRERFGVELQAEPQFFGFAPP